MLVDIDSLWTVRLIPKSHWLPIYLTRMQNLSSWDDPYTSRSTPSPTIPKYRWFTMTHSNITALHAPHGGPWLPSCNSPAPSRAGSSLGLKPRLDLERCPSSHSKKVISCHVISHHIVVYIYIYIIYIYT